jgi:hypothetical protein
LDVSFKSVRRNLKLQPFIVAPEWIQAVSRYRVLVQNIPALNSKRRRMAAFVFLTRKERPMSKSVCEKQRRFRAVPHALQANDASSRILRLKVALPPR